MKLTLPYKLFKPPRQFKSGAFPLPPIFLHPAEYVFIQKRPPQITIEKASLYLAQITASYGTRRN
jgi:hypothetical protein